MKPYSIKKHERGQQILCIHNSSLYYPLPKAKKPWPKPPNRTHKTKDNIRHTESLSPQSVCVKITIVDGRDLLSPFYTELEFTQLSIL